MDMAAALRKDSVTGGKSDPKRSASRDGSAVGGKQEGCRVVEGL